MTGATRQAVNKWHSAVRGPQERHRNGLKRAYDLALIQRSRLQELIDLARNQIDLFKVEWRGNNTLEFELDMWTEQFMRARLPWLMSDDFFNEGYNRRGEYREFQERPMFGWSDQESQKAFIRDYSL